MTAAICVLMVVVFCAGGVTYMNLFGIDDRQIRELQLELEVAYLRATVYRGFVDVDRRHQADDAADMESHNYCQRPLGEQFTNVKRLGANVDFVSQN